MINPPLEFVLSDTRPGQGRFTTANLRVRINGLAVWPVLGEDVVAVEIQIDDLLSYLTEFWKPLMLRQVFPLAVNPDRPSLLRAEATRRWRNMPADVVAEEAEVVDAFEEAHDLSRAFAGQFGLPPFWMMRTGASMTCEASARVWRLPYDAAREALSSTGDDIAQRLDGLEEGRWSDLIAAWRSRDEGKAEDLLAWSIGTATATAGRFIDDNLLEAPANVVAAANDDDEIRLAARMAGALPEAQIRVVISLARNVPKVEAPELEAMSREVKAYLAKDFRDHAPFAQGEAAASFVRDSMGYASVRYLDIFELASGFGVRVSGVATDPATLDGLAVWGPKHGPGALLNEKSWRIVNRGELHRNAGARVTLAHEFCHLLLDREHALSAVDVLGGRMPNAVEGRAKAFAGELLLPRRVAGDLWFGAGQPRDHGELSSLLMRLIKRYRVTRSVAAWKLEHGARGHDVDLSFMLDLIVPNR